MIANDSTFEKPPTITRNSPL